MILFHRFSISVVIASMLLCSNALAKPSDDVPPTVDVNVVNTPDVIVANDEGIPVPVVVQSSPVTHIGRAPSEHVNLTRFTLIQQSFGSDFRGFLRQLPDGSLEEGSNEPEFGWIIPAGKVLVVTDIDFEIGGTDMPDPGQTLRISLSVTEPTETGWRSSVVYRNGAIVAGDGRVYGSFHINSGLVIPDDRFLTSRLDIDVPVDSFFHVIGYIVDAE